MRVSRELPKARARSGVWRGRSGFFSYSFYLQARRALSNAREGNVPGHAPSADNWKLYDQRGEELQSTSILTQRFGSSGKTFCLSKRRSQESSRPRNPTAGDRKGHNTVSRFPRQLAEHAANPSVTRR